MKAIEFEARIENGVIRLPEKYGEYDNAYVRVIILAKEPVDASVRKERLLAAMLQLQEKDIFPSITDAVEWQRQQRDEWE